MDVVKQHKIFWRLFIMEINLFFGMDMIQKKEKNRWRHTQDKLNIWQMLDFWERLPFGREWITSIEIVGCYTINLAIRLMTKSLIYWLFHSRSSWNIISRTGIHTSFEHKWLEKRNFVIRTWKTVDFMEQLLDMFLSSVRNTLVHFTWF